MLDRPIVNRATVERFANHMTALTYTYERQAAEGLDAVNQASSEAWDCWGLPSSKTRDCLIPYRNTDGSVGYATAGWATATAVRLAAFW